MAKTIEEVRTEKFELQTKIAKLLCDFEKDNNVIVSDLRIGRFDKYASWNSGYIGEYNVNVEVKL